MLISPVSSETMRITASLCMVSPNAARWRVPMRPTPGSVSASGSTQPQVQQLRAVPDREDHRQPEQQLHRLGAANQLEQLIQEERDHQHIEHVAPADVLEEEVEVAQELAHPTPPL